MTASADFADRIKELGQRVALQRQHISTEEATKHAMVLPFIQILGYDVFNPAEVTPELIADVGTKKGEKVDYAVLMEGQPRMIFECKAHTCDLREAQYSQLFRYFHVTDARFAVLTNGVEYWFFTDLDAQNKMDDQPFLKVSLLNLRDGEVEELKKFTRGNFDEGNILSTASELKYVRELKKILVEELSTPSDDFLRLLVSRVYSGPITAKVRAEFAPFIVKAYKDHLAEVFSQRLKRVIGNQNETEVTTPPDDAEDAPAPVAEELVDTTAEELEGFMIVRAIAAAETDVERVVMRDVKSYCGVLFDNNNRKPVCRLYLNGKRWQIGLFDCDDRTETRYPLENVTGIYMHAEAIRSTLRRYLGPEDSGQAV